MSQTKITLGIFVLFLLALPLASADITDYVAYYPWEYTSQLSEFNHSSGLDGIVVANDSDVYNYGRDGSIARLISRPQAPELL